MESRVDHRMQRIRYVGGDYIAFFMAFLIFNIIRYSFFYYSDDCLNILLSPKLIMEQIFVPAGMLLLAWLTGYYNRVFEKSRLQELNSTILTCAIGSLLLFLVMLLNDKLGRRRDNYQIIFILFILFFIFSYTSRLIITSRSIKKFREKKWKTNTIFIGDKSRINNVINRLNSIRNRPGVEKIATYPLLFQDDEETEKLLEEIRDYCRIGAVDQIVIATAVQNDKKVMETLYKLFDLNIPIKIMPDEFSFLNSSIRLNDIYAEPLIDLTSPSMGDGSKNIKRVFDVLFSALALLILAPFLLFIAIAIKLTTRGPVFYSQERIGFRHKPFYIHKFRSMRVNAEKDGPQLSSDNDTRVTPIGHWLRKYRIDELPQFLNVLKGDMSLVGPRPERAFYIDKIVKQLPYYTLLSQVRPGITSWGMVKYGYAKNIDEMIKRARYDLLYIANMSLAMDIKILIYTIKPIVEGKGV